MKIKSRDEIFDNKIEKPYRVANWVDFILMYACRPALKVAFRYVVTGKENVPTRSDKPFIFACNHVTFLDPVFLNSAVYTRLLRFPARDTLFKPIFGDLIARCGAIPIKTESADSKSLRRCVNVVKRGECLGIFPEGTRMNSSEKEYKPHPGLVLIAKIAKADIVPVGINGAERIKPKGKKFIRFPKVYINIGKPISLDDYKDVDKDKLMETVLDDVMKKIDVLKRIPNGYVEPL
ncbi:MAG: 1-acyl-sn-glycerol-3-phosphate acyltransferase [Coriobacteriales bacterium]|nr:1-acyl-sn-glycerol-3-phosphate acyltransferase [Coriobacteriales bacterium]